MSRSVFPILICFALATSCGSAPQMDDTYVQPNSLMAREIDDRIAQIPYQQREELFNNLLWLAQSGEQSIPSLVTALRHNDPKVRSNSLWVLGRMRDRRVIPDMRALTQDQNETVRLEAARSLVLLGDLQHVPVLLQGLDSDKNQVRYLCHEALQQATSRDFGYDHLEDDVVVRRQATYRWRKWWSDQSGDPWFAKDYASDHNLDTFEAETSWIGSQPPMPNGEVDGVPQDSVEIVVPDGSGDGNGSIDGNPNGNSNDDPNGNSNGNQNGNASMNNGSATQNPGMNAGSTDSGSNAAVRGSTPASPTQQGATRTTPAATNSPQR